MDSGEESAEAAHRTLPGWVRGPFGRFRAYLDETRQVLSLTTNGIGLLPRFNRILIVLDQTDVEEDRIEPERMEAAREAAASASGQLERGLPLAYAHSVVDLWTAVEILVHDMVIERVAQDPKILKRELKKVHTDIMFASEQERIEFVLDDIERDFEKKKGAGRLEEWASAIGFGGDVAENIRDNLFELQQVRNVIVHRGSVVDRHFLEACPKFKAEIGMPLRIGDEEYKRYYFAAMGYGLTLVRRIRAAIEQGPEASGDHS